MKNLSIILLFIFIFTLTSCRYDGYTPTGPEADFTIDDEIQFFQKPERGDIYHLGDSISIEYSTFTTSDLVNIYIIKKSHVIYKIAEEEENDGNFIWQTNDDTQTSVQYQIKIENPEDPEIFILSDRFGVINNH